VSEVEPTDANEPVTALRALLRAHAGALAVALVAASGDMAGATDPGEDPEQAVLRAAAAATLRKAVVQLPPEQRALVERHYFGEERFDEIAADLGISKSWASRLHAQAVGALAAALRGQEPPEEQHPCRIRPETPVGPQGCTPVRAP
jgi:RNA polymerase sigma factor for flagellar operon FliA